MHIDAVTGLPATQMEQDFQGHMSNSLPCSPAPHMMEHVAGPHSSVCSRFACQPAGGHDEFSMSVIPMPTQHEAPSPLVQEALLQPSPCVPNSQVYIEEHCIEASSAVQSPLPTEIPLMSPILPAHQAHHQPLSFAASNLAACQPAFASSLLFSEHAADGCQHVAHMDCHHVAPSAPAASFSSHAFGQQFLPQADHAQGEFKLLADYAVACPPGNASIFQQDQPEQTDVAQVDEKQLAHVPALPKTAKALSIIRPGDESEMPCRPALVRTADGTVLSAVVDQRSNHVQWEWARAATAMGLKTQKDFQFLKRNQEQHYSELVQAEITPDAINYQGQGSEARGQHSMGSSALILIILLVSMTKQHALLVKSKALTLAIDLLKAAVATLVVAESCVGIVYGKDQRYHEQTLQIDSTGIVSNLHTLLMQHPGCTWAWSQLMTKGFCNVKITSAITHPTLWDLLLFLAWAKNSPGVKRYGHFVANFCGQKYCSPLAPYLTNLPFSNHSSLLNNFLC